MDVVGLGAWDIGIVIGDGKLVHIVIDGKAKVVPVGGLGEVPDEGVGSLGGGIYRTAEDAAQGIKPVVAGARAPNHGLDLAVIIHKAQIHGIGAVADDYHIIKVGAHQLHHVLLALAQLQVVPPSGEILVAVGVFRVGPPGHVLGQIHLLGAGCQRQ